MEQDRVLDLSVGGLKLLSAKVIKKILGWEDLNLKLIDLWNNPFGDLGIKSICKSIKTIKNLVILKIGNCDLTDEGIKSIVDTVGEHEYISVLNLSNQG